MALFERKQSFFGRLQEKIEDAVLVRPTPDEEMLEALEDALITSDLGMDTTFKIVDSLRDSIRRERIWNADGVKEQIKTIVEEILDKGERLKLSEDFPLFIMIIGVNGSGKTTTIAKMAKRFKDEGKSVLLIAADTFRAAASEQLSIWGERIGVPVIKHGEGSDPSAVIFDGINAAKARGVDVVICDTAGRLQTKRNLMAELAKMNKVIGRGYPEASRETLLVIDATTGKNAISQVKEFGETGEITGLVITKMDGTAKGGIAVTIADEFDMPVKFIGVGERAEDLLEFNPAEFAGSIFEEN